ncbi:OFA family MFS transporter [Veillonella sp. R32]|uniref:L-lactate MFS transporter n=1 Tax=Veillonella sp. R32 TaxID=2021312 RepID=UPI00138A45FB|nr:OFA family MFS transporter [Veillonella sp. R32]KAF1683454.1 MFS transporter [Veillonella sp. R32]
MRNRWLIALAAIGIHICIGSVYAWSVLTRPIMTAMGWSLKETTWTFSLAILFLGLSAGLLGSVAEKMGPKKSGLLSTLFFGVGMLGTSFALSEANLTLLYIFYGVIGGIGLGVGYITPVSTLVKYFPRNRGFATGLAIMGFGFASLIAGPLMQWLTTQYGLVETFQILGIAYILVMIASSLYLKPPVNTVTATATTHPSQVLNRGMNAHDAMRTWQFSALWWIFFINITCGIGLLAVASPMAQEIVGMTANEAASMVGIIGLLNGLGRIVWSTVSDYLGRPFTYILFFAIEILAFLALGNTNTSFVFQFLVFAIITCYGGGFACMPAYLSDLFGTKQLSAIHGRVLTAWGMAGIAGPTLVSFLRESTNSYSGPLFVFSALFVLNLIIAIALKVYTKDRHFEADTTVALASNNTETTTTPGKDHQSITA